MPLNLDSCITGIFVPGNIGASSGLPPVAPTVPSLFGPAPALIEQAAASDTLSFFMGELLHETVNATAVVSYPAIVSATVVETTAADSTQDAAIALPIPRSAILPGVFVNSAGTPRAANVYGVMVNL